MDIKPVDDDRLAIGAEAIAREVFENKLTPRQTYRWAENEGATVVFRIRGKLATWVKQARATLGASRSPAK
jgi:hypothetical protein